MWEREREIKDILDIEVCSVWYEGLEVLDRKVFSSSK